MFDTSILVPYVIILMSVVVHVLMEVYKLYILSIKQQFHVHSSLSERNKTIVS